VSSRSPADAYAAAKLRTSLLTAFARHYPFGLDQFQVDACAALERGRGLLVAAPTGAGKTVVGEFAVHCALERNLKCFYTTPIKALSNQKYAELVARYGADRVGLLTGDNAINSEAPIVVMTTEVLRNMLYAESTTLHDLGYVVMDEVHYLADRFRGAVWEEVIILLPDRVTVVALSATVSNAEEFGAWLNEVRGDTQVIVEEHRPVPLYQHILAGDTLHDLFVDDDQTLVNPELIRLVRRRQHPRRRDPLTPWRIDVIDVLKRAQLLPAIVFVFSRAGCDAAVEQCRNAHLRLTSKDEARTIREVAIQATLGIPDADLDALDFEGWVESLTRGIAAHHAGMLPVFKEVVENLFQQGLIKVVFATETLALGINMPARSVVLEKLVKWNGEAHVELTPGEFTQLTGRAGRRGIDVEGHAVITWHAGIDPRAVAGLASTRTYPLRSSFQPSYNMAVNLVARLGWHTAREVLETSFAQFQADRSVVGLARSVRKHEEALTGYREAQVCHLGDFAEYASIRDELNQAEKRASRQRSLDRRSAVESSLAGLRPGDVAWLPAGKRSGFMVLVEADSKHGRPLFINAQAQAQRIAVQEISGPVVRVGQVRIPKAFHHRKVHARRELADRLRALTETVSRPDPSVSGQVDDDRIIELRRALRQHPCHGCADREQHARWAERAVRTAREIADLEQRIAARTSSVASRFEAVCAILAERGYLTSPGEGAEVTAAGDQLRWIYAEADLLVSASLLDGVWNALNPAQLAAVVSTLVYESRIPDEGAPRIPRGDIEAVIARMHDLWNDIHTDEQLHRVSLTRELDAGFVWATYRWAQGATLREILSREDFTAGDFVRWMRQVIDLLAQVEAGAEDPIRSRARDAIGLLRRGVVDPMQALDERIDG
jgi:ATP-dependent RNA helicase HelY